MHKRKQARMQMRLFHLGECSLLVALLLIAGCSEGAFSFAQAEQQEEAAELPPPPPPEPGLEVTRDAHLTLFGELPDRARLPFHASASSPMKQHSFASEGADFDVDMSPDGKWLAFSSTRHTTQPDLYMKAIDGRAVRQITSDPSADVQPCMSPDGKMVAFASNRAGNWDLWLKRLDTGHARQLTSSPLHEVHPSFSPDGNRLVYCMFNDRTAQWELWTIGLDQPGSARMVGVGLFPEWSPSGDSIVYQRARQRGGRWFSIWRVDLVNGEPNFPMELASSSEMALIQPTWSTDGLWVAYGTAELLIASAGEGPGDVRMPETQGDIWIMQADGSGPVQLTDGESANFGPVWSPDGRVYFTSLQNGRENVWSVKPTPAQMAELPVADEDTNTETEPPKGVAMQAGPSSGG